MNQMLNNGERVRVDGSQAEVEVGVFLGGGGQGEVYKARVGDREVALKWYFPHYLRQDQRQKERLEEAIRNGAPTDRFLWPFALVSVPEKDSFGYLMELREPHFKGIVDMMTDRADPTFRALATAGFELVNSYFQLHAKGMCYRDISFGNVFFDPVTGEVRICDNDNVDYNKREGTIGGTPDFMAPEIVQGNALPSTQTDLFSLSVLLFYIFHIHHPLQGAKMMAIHSWDLPARRKIMGDQAVFIFDPADTSNRALALAEDPTGEAGDNALKYWPIYPQFLKDRFMEAFTQGLHDPGRRVAETVWRADMIRLRDSIFYCPHCGKENFYDSAALQARGGQPGNCWACSKQLKLPPRMRLGNNVILLNHDTKLFPHHVDGRHPNDFSKPVAELSQNPRDPSQWGLKNLMENRWDARLPDGTIKIVEPGRSIMLSLGLCINFGNVEGAIHL